MLRSQVKLPGLWKLGQETVVWVIRKEGSELRLAF